MLIQDRQRPVKEGIKIDGLKKWLVMLGAFVIVVVNFLQMGVSLPVFLLRLTTHHTDTPDTDWLLFKQGIYFMTDIKIGEPTTIFTSVAPINKQEKLVKEQLAQVKGYFLQDEDSHLTKAELEAQLPEEENEMAQALPDLTDISDVYTHYFSSSGKMDFGLDMIEKWDFNALARQKLSLSEEKKGPQVLIFHTHAREDYIGGLTVVDIGEALEKTLEEQYGVEVLHIKDEFYAPDNATKYPTQGEYERMEPVIEKVLKENPSISVALDIHRDGVNGDVHLVTDLNGKPTAKIMFVNGLCLNRNLNGEVEEKADLPNPYLADNLAFSLQSTITMQTLYPGLSRKIYLNEWRYSTHMIPQSLLVEWGANTNTSEEAMNAVEPMARVLMTVLGKD